MKLELYNTQNKSWPQEGKHIMAQYNDETIIVYQAYKPSIGKFAIEHGYFGGDFSYTRMSWIKPNFLWMMFRCGWAEKEGQEVVLAITIPRTLFDEILEDAVASSFRQSNFNDQQEWKDALAKSEVRLQWDPDHSPTGGKEERRAIQLGLRGDMLRRFARDEIVKIEDVTNLVKEQYNNVKGDYRELITPIEKNYIPKSVNALMNVGLEQPK